MVEGRTAAALRTSVTTCLLTVAAGQALAAGEPCQVSAVLEPPSAFVGEQILHRTLIERRSDVRHVEWERSLRFPAFHSEWLPGRPQDTEKESQGARYLVSEEHRALFATRSGVLEIPSATLLCSKQVDGTDRKRAHRASLPALSVRIEALPESGAPDSFRGLVGPVQVQTNVDRTQIELGDSVRVSVLLRGTGNLRDAALPLQELDRLAELEVFREPATIDTQTGDKLYVRRAFRLDLVPAEVGSLQIPETRIDYFDPDTRLYKVARAPAIEIEVLERDAATTRRAEANAGSGARQSTAAPESDSRTIWGSLALAGLVAATTVGWRLKRRRSQWQSVEDALADARAAREQGDARGEAAGYTRALRATLAVTNPDLAGLEPEAVCAQASRPELGSAAALLEKLDRIRFAPGPDRPDGAEVDELIAQLQQHRERD